VAESTTRISCWDLPTRHLIRRLVLSGNARGEIIAMSPDARFLATSLGGRARVLWARSGRPLADWSPHEGAEVQDLAFAADGLELATVGANGSVRTWDLPSAAGRLEGRATFERTGRRGHKPGRKSDGE
jgi:WD40 repeat protein